MQHGLSSEVDCSICRGYWCWGKVSERASARAACMCPRRDLIIALTPLPPPLLLLLLLLTHVTNDA